MAAKYVDPYRTKGKNDLNDAVAICDAVQRPNSRFIPVKSPERQAILATHRVREHWVNERTALINRIRALLAEFGIIIPTGRAAIHGEVPLILEAAENGLPDIARAVVADCFDHLQTLNQRIADTEQCFDMVTKASPNAQRILNVRGIGPQTATAIIATIGKGEQFDSGIVWALLHHQTDYQDYAA